MGPTIKLRSRAAQALGAVMAGVALVALVTSAFEGGRSVLLFGAPVVLFGLLGWAAFWRPYVEVSDGAVTVANTLRTIEVPWPAVESVDGRYGLKLRTAYGVVTAWSASAPAGKQRARREDSEAALTVTRRLEALRAAGYLDDARLERPAPRTTWHVPVLVAGGVLLVAAVVLPLLA